MRRISIYVLFIFSFSAIRLNAQTEHYKIELMPFNATDHNDFCPVYFNGGIVFTTDRPVDVFVRYVTEEDKILYNLFYAKQEDSTNWSKPVVFSKDIRSRYNDGPATFSKDERTIFFTQNMLMPPNVANRLKRQNRLGLNYAKGRRDEWGNVKPFQYNDVNYNMAHPSLSDDGTMLFFASDKDGGYGGMDIYVSRLKRGRWSEPENLGPIVNSANDDVYPYYHSSGKLFFSSRNRMGGLGKLDLYYTVETNGEWVTLNHLEEPLNTPYDDFGLIADDNFLSGYFSSNRRSMKDDIYSFKFVEPKFECDTIQQNSYCVTVFEEGAEALDETAFNYEWDLGDGTKQRGVKVRHCYKKPGDYTIQLNVIDAVTKELYYNQATYQLPIHDIEQVYITSPDTIEINQRIKFESFKTNLPNFKTDKYYWITGDGERNAESSFEHFYKKKGSYKVQLGVIGRADGSDEEIKHCSYKQIIVIPKKK